jgi:hypothetical protein
MKRKQQENVKLAARSPALEAARQRHNRFSARFKNVQDKARLELADLLANMFDQADDALFEMADRAASNVDQNIYFEAMRELRIRRRGMEMEFGQRYDDSFLALAADSLPLENEEIDMASLALVQDNEIEETLALEGMVARAMNDCIDELSLLTMRFDSLLDTVRITNDNNPVAPQFLCESFVACCASLDVDIKARLVVLKLFEKRVVSEFTSLYRTLNRDLAEQGVLANVSLADRARRRPGPAFSGRRGGFARELGSAGDYRDRDPGDAYAGDHGDAGGGPNASADAVFFQLQNLLQHAGGFQGTGQRSGVAGAHSGGNRHEPHGLPARAVHRAQVVDLLTSLQSYPTETQLDDFGYVAVQPRAGELRERIISNLNQNRPQGEPVYALGEVDEDAVRLVSLLFQFVLEDDALAAPLKSLLSMLQVPMTKVALIDKSFFGKKSHPARKLLNTMAHAGIGWAPGGNAERDFLYRKFKDAVETVLSFFEDDIGVFETVLQDFQSFLENERRRASIVEQRTLETEQGKARAELAQATVAETIATSIAGKTLPAIAREVLEQGWSKVLFLILAREGEDSGSWKSACRVMDELVWSVQPKPSASERERLGKLKVGLFSNLQAGLARVGISHFAMGHFFDQLSALYDDLSKPAEQEPEPVVSKEPEDQAPTKDQTRTENQAPPTKSGGSSLDDMLSMSRVHPSGAIASSAKVDEAHSAAPSESVNAAETDAGSAAVESCTVAVDPAMLAKVDKLSVGSWVQFKQSESAGFRCRLAAVLKPTGKYIFVNRAGKKVAEWTREEIAANVAKEIVMLLDDRQLFDRALESVISQLQHSRCEA